MSRPTYRIRRNGSYARLMRDAIAEFAALELKDKARRHAKGGQLTRHDGSRRPKGRRVPLSLPTPADDAPVPRGVRVVRLTPGGV